MGEQGDTTDQEPKKAGSSGCLWIGGVFVVLAVLGFASCEPDTSEDSTYGAQQACEGWVKNQLKSPATADFSGVVTAGPDEGPWTVTGSVDAENSFGAALRSPWTCTVRLDGDIYRGTARLAG